MNMYTGAVIGTLITVVLGLADTPPAWTIVILCGAIGHIINKQEDEKKKRNQK